MSVLIKQGVIFRCTHREIRRAVAKLDILCQQNGCELVITSAAEGSHSAGSLHYDGKAVDIRKLGLFHREIVQILGPGYDVVDEDDHWHIEWDPK